MTQGEKTNNGLLADLIRKYPEYPVVAVMGGAREGARIGQAYIGKVIEWCGRRYISAHHFRKEYYEKNEIWLNTQTGYDPDRVPLTDEEQKTMAAALDKIQIHINEEMRKRVADAIIVPLE